MAPYVQRRKVWLTPNTRVSCNNATKTQNPLKLSGVPKIRKQISAVSGPKFTTLWGHMEQVLLFNKFFSDCQYVPQLRRYGSTKLFDGAPMAIFGVIFTSSISASRVQNISDMCESTVDIQSPTAEIRRGKRQKERRRKKETTGQKYNGLPYSIGRP